MEGLACQNCRQMSGEFTILNCDHVLCAECLWSQVRTSLHGTNSLVCPCGSVTVFTSNSKITEAKTMKKQTVSQLLTEMTLSSARGLTSNDQLIQQQPKGQIENELYFLDLQFKKSLEEVENNFKQVVQVIRKKYTNLMASIRNFWHQEVAGCQSIAILDFSSMLAKKYNIVIGVGLTAVNQSLLKHLTTIKFDTKTHQRIHSASSSLNRPHSSYINKENTLLSTSNHYPSANLLNAVLQLKKRNQIIRKTGLRQKTFFNRN